MEAPYSLSGLIQISGSKLICKDVCYTPLKVPYCEKHVFSGLYIYKLVLLESTNSQNEESKQVLHLLQPTHW